MAAGVKLIHFLHFGLSYNKTFNDWPKRKQRVSFHIDPVTLGFALGNIQVLGTRGTIHAVPFPLGLAINKCFKIVSSWSFLARDTRSFQVCPTSLEIFPKVES